MTRSSPTQLLSKFAKSQNDHSALLVLNSEQAKPSMWTNLRISDYQHVLQASNSLPPRLFTTDTGKALSMPGNRSIARRTHRINDKRMTLRIKTAQLGQTLMPALVCLSLKLCQIGTLHLILHGVSCMKQEKRMSNSQ